jgi:ATP-dependent Clp endopeptidase proteolytic subunit ClpP
VPETPQELIEPTAAKLAAEREAFLAQAAEHAANARNVDIERVRCELALEAERVELERVRYKRSKELASNEHHHVYNFASAVDSKTAAHCMQVLQDWQRMDAQSEHGPTPLTIVFNSPGGSVIDGLALFDFIQQVRRAGHHVTTSALGMAASMAGILLQAGDHRVMAKESWVLIHQVSASAMGSFGEMADRLSWLDKVQERILDIFANRAQASNAEKPVTRRTIARNWERTDWWIDSDEALKLGLVDEVA